LLSACGDYANTVRGDVTVPLNSGANPPNLPDPNKVPKPTTPGGYAVSPSPVTIEEVLADPHGPDDGNQYVELFNASAFAADIGGWVLTTGPDAFTFPYGFTVPAGARVLVHVNNVGNADGGNVFASAIRTLDPNAGSLALLRAGMELVDFVQWGAAGNPFEGAAAGSGEWAVGDFVPRAVEGRSINYTGQANDSTAWFEGDITPGS